MDTGVLIRRKRMVNGGGILRYGRIIQSRHLYFYILLCLKAIFATQPGKVYERFTQPKAPVEKAGRRLKGGKLLRDLEAEG